MSLIIATCQFPTSDDPRRNVRYVRRQMRVARERGARVAHFPEACLSGYAGADRASNEDIDWALLEECTRAVIGEAAALGLWVVIGSAHRLTGRRKPHNSLYVIDDRGRLRDRYDKRFCASDAKGRGGELSHYTPGDHPCTFDIDGVRCATLICHEYRYPELYRELEHSRVELVFHSFHAGHLSPKAYRSLQRDVGESRHGINPGSTLPEITMPAGMIASASNNHLWISCSNSSARESCWPSFVVRPDGVMLGRLVRNRAGVLVSTIDDRARYYDSTAAWRRRAARGVLHSGRLVDDERSKSRQTL
jgi:predicted amidohydrolase